MMSNFVLLQQLLLLEIFKWVVIKASTSTERFCELKINYNKNNYRNSIYTGMYIMATLYKQQPLSFVVQRFVKGA